MFSIFDFVKDVKQMFLYGWIFNDFSLILTTLGKFEISTKAVEISFFFLMCMTFVLLIMRF